MEARLCPLFSGSSGNCTYLGCGGTHILIDAGLPGRPIEEALTIVGVRPDDISALLITHEHGDHIRGAGVLARRLNIPVYANERTWAAMKGQLGTIPPPQRRIFFEEESFFVGTVEVQPFSIPHDAADPVGYCFYLEGGKKISVATDLGHVNVRILDRIAESDILLFEANHDVAMLESNPNYPSVLKRRIRGSRGHLSNEQCAEALKQLLLRGVRRIFLGHLSEHNNTPSIALEAVTDYLAHFGAQAGQDYQIGIVEPVNAQNFRF